MKYILLLIYIVSTGCTKLPTDFEKEKSYAYVNIENTRIAKGISNIKKNDSKNSGIHLLLNGVDSFVARMALSEIAEQTIDVQYYLYNDDLVGSLLTYQLIKAANRGVRVRVLVDDMGMDSKKKDLEALLITNHPNISVRVFNPFHREYSRFSQLITHEKKITRRMHNKSFTVDNQATIIGGRNIGNGYFGADPLINFADIDIVGIGQIPKDVSNSFDKYWNHELSYPVDVLVKKYLTDSKKNKLKHEYHKKINENINSEYYQSLKNSNLAINIREGDIKYVWGNANVLYDNPDKILADLSNKEYNLVPQLKPYIDEIEEELLIFSPYFVPGKLGVDFLIDLVNRGVKVKILTNSLYSNDVKIVHSGYAKYRKDLLANGIELYEINDQEYLNKSGKKRKKGWMTSSKATLHAKSFVFDRKKIFIGSLNLDPRSVIHNTEIGVILDTEELAEKVNNDFDKNKKNMTFKLELIDDNIIWNGRRNNKKVVFDVDPYTSFGERLGVGIMGLLPIESQL